MKTSSNISNPGLNPFATRRPITAFYRSAVRSTGPMFFLVVLILGNVHAGNTWSVDSPDMSNRISLELKGGKLTYSVGHQHTPPAWQVKASGYEALLPPAPLGIATREQDFSRALEFVHAGPAQSYSERYSMLTGKQRRLDNHYGERRIRFRNARGAEMEVQLRAYAEGVAFRYAFPGEAGTYTIMDEATGFHLPTPGLKWILPYSQVSDWAPSYEEDFHVEVPIGMEAPTEAGWSFPALFELERGMWILLSESGMTGDTYGAHLQAEAEGGLYRIRLPEEGETYGVYPRESTAALPFSTPWRVIMIAEDPGGILENNLVHHLATPNQIEDTSWIEPGPSTWSWLFDKSSQTDLHRLVPFVDLTAELGWPYTLVDADWHLMENGSIYDVLDHAADKGVGLHVWYNSGGPHNRVKPIGPADRMHIPELRRAEMAWMQKVGIRGIKVDFMNSDKQGIMQLYLDIISDAADHQLLVNFHGSTLPRGWQRTWPNLVTMEAVKGGEQLWNQDFADYVPVHNTILPFTRNVVGSMDYTPFTFQGTVPDVSTTTTWAHELATTVVFESGVQHVSETVENFEGLPYFVWRFLENLETAWDETLYLDGRPGEKVVLARRSGNRWIVAGINGKDHPVSQSLRHEFLHDQEYSFELIFDGPSKTEFSRTIGVIQPGDPLSVTMKPQGGFVLTLKPAEH